MFANAQAGWMNIITVPCLLLRQPKFGVFEARLLYDGRPLSCGKDKLLPLLPHHIQYLGRANQLRGR